MTETLKIDYVEFTTPDLEGENAFFSKAFGWQSQAYGDDYLAIKGAGLEGGMERAPTIAPLIVLYGDDLEAALAQVKAAGAHISKDIYAFPGGRRFEFTTPGGTAMAVWTKGES